MVHLKLWIYLCGIPDPGPFRPAGLSAVQRLPKWEEGSPRELQLARLSRGVCGPAEANRLVFGYILIYLRLILAKTQTVSVGRFS